MVIELNVLYIKLNSPEDYFSEPENYLGKILGISEKLSIWKNLNFYGRWGAKKLKKFENVPEIVENSTSWKHSNYIISSDNVVNPECAIVLTVKKASIGIRLFVTDAFKEVHEQGFLDELISYCQEIYLQFRKIARLGPGFNITISDLAYPRPRPPYIHTTWAPGSVVTFASVDFHQHNKLGDIEQLEAVVDASNHGPMDRTLVFDDLVILKWVDDLVDQDKILKGMMACDLFFKTTLELPIEGGYNKFGDVVEPYESLQKKQHLTFYDSFTKNGYKSAVVNPDGSVDEALFEELSIWIENLTTPDGVSISSLSLILPDRKSALQIADRAFDIGISKVLYVSEDGQWYNPLPPGLWLN